MTDTTWAGANWSATPVPGSADTATFNDLGNGNTVIDLGTGVAIKSITFDTASAAGYTIGSGAVGSQTLSITNAGSITLNSTVATNQVFNSAVVLGTDTTAQTFTITNSSTAASLTLAGGISEFAATAAAKTLVLTGPGNIALTGNIAANSVAFQNLILTSTSTGSVTLSGTNTISTLNVNNTGTIDIGAGTLTITGVTAGGGNAIQSSTGGTINASGGGSLVIPGNTTADGGNFGTANGTTLTINAKISGTSTNAIEFFQVASGTGKVVLTNNANDFAGPVVINSGVLSVSNIGNQGSTTSQLGKGTTINIGNTTGTGITLLYTGNGETTNRIINLSATTGAAIIDQSGSGVLKFTSAFTATGLGAKVLTLAGSNTGSGEIAAAIVNSTGFTTGVTKSGTNTWVLSGANSYTGTTTVSAGILKMATGGTLVAGNALTTAAAGTFDTGGVALNLGTVNNAGVITNTGAAANLIIGNGSTGAGSWSGPINLTWNQGATSSVLSGSINTTGTFTNSGTGVGTATLSGGIASSVTTITQNSASSALTISGTNNTATSFNGTYVITNGSITFPTAAAVGQAGSTTTITGSANGAAIFGFAGVNAFLAANVPVTGMNGVIAISSAAAAEDLNFSNATVGTAAGLNTPGIFGATGTVNYTGVFTPQTPGVYKLGGGGGTLTFNQNITSGSVTIGGFGGGTVALAGTNSYTGGTTVNNGILSIGSDANIGGAATPLAIAAGAGIQITGTTLTNLDSHTPTFAPGAVTFDINNAANTFTVGQNLTLAAGTLTKAGAGTLILSGTNTGTGATSITGGKLIMGSASAVPSGTLSMAASTTLDLNGNNLSVSDVLSSTATSIITDNASGTGISTFAVSNTATTINALIKDGATRDIAVTLFNSNGSATFAATSQSTFSGGLKLLNSAGGTRLIVGGNPTFTGSPGALVSGPFGTGPITIGQAATEKAGIYVSVAGVTIANEIIFNTALGTDRAGIRYDGTGGVLSGRINANLAPATFSTNGVGAVAITGQITGLSGLTIDNSFGTTMTVTLNNTSGVNPNNYQGATIIAGTKGILTLGSANQIPDGATAGDVTNNGLMNLGGFAETLNGLNGTGTFDGVSGSPVLTLGNNNATGTFSGVLKNTAGTLNIVKTGTGTQVLSGANTSTGTYTVNGGTLQFGKPASLYNATAASWTAANIKVNSATTLAFNVGGATDFTPAQFATLAALGTGTGGLLPGSSIGIDSTNIPVGVTLAGPLADTNGGANSIGLTKLGTNNVTLAGTNTYTGPTVVAGGTLTLPTTASLAPASAITARTGGAFLIQGTQSISNAITITGGASAASAGTLSQVDGAFNTVNLDAVTIGGTAGNAGRLAMEFGTGSDKLVLSGNLTVASGGALVDLTQVGTYDGTSRVLLTANAIDTSSGGTIGIGTTAGNTNNFILTLANDGSSLTLNQSANTTAAPATAWFKGNLSGLWSQTSGGNAANNFTTDAAGTTSATQLPGATTDVRFYAAGATTANLASTLGQNFTIKSLTLDGGTLTNAVSIAGGGGTLTISPTDPNAGITMNTGAGALTISAPLVLGADQTWTNSTASAGLTVTGGISGAGNLKLVGGTSSFTVSDTTLYTGNTNIVNGFGTGSVTLASGTLNLRANGDGTTNAQTLTYNNQLIVTGTSTINADYQAAAGGNGKTLAFSSSGIGAVTVNITGASHGYFFSLGNVTLNAPAGGTTSVVPNATIWAGMNDVTGSATAGNTNTLALGGAVTSANSFVSGAITDGTGGGNVAVTKGPVTPWTFSGSTSNTYTGGTVLTQAAAGGIFRPLTLAKTGGAIAIPGDLTFGNLGTGYTNVNLGGNEQIADTGVLKFNATTGNWGYFKLLGFSETVAGLSDIGTTYSGVIENMEAEVINTNSTLTLSGSGTYSFNGYIRNRASGTGTGLLLLNWKGSGKQTLAGANISYTGTTTISAGTLELNGATIFASPVNFDAASTGTLQIASATQGVPGLTTTDTTSSSVFVQNAAGTNSVLTVTQGTNGVFGGILRNNPDQTTPSTFGLTKAGTGTLTLTNANTHSGTTALSAGTLQLNHLSALQNSQLAMTGGTLALRQDASSTFVMPAFKFGTAATFDVGAATIGPVNQVLTLPAAQITGSGTFNFTNSTADGYTLALGALDMQNTSPTFNATANLSIASMTAANVNRANTYSFTGTGTVTVGTISNDAVGVAANPANNVGVTINSATTGKLVFTATNAYTGTTTVTAGTLDIGATTQSISALSLGGGAAGTTGTVVGVGGTMNLAGNVTYVATNNPNGASISVSNLGLGGTSRTFTVGDSTAAAVDLTVSSALSNGTLIKAGAGVLSLTGNLNLTQIQDTAGTILITNATNLNSTPVLVNGGTFDLGGTTQNASNFTLTSGSIVNGTLTTTNLLKQGPGTLTLSALTTASTVTINQGLANTTSNPATSSTINLNFAAAGAPVSDLINNTATLTLGGPVTSVVGGGALQITGAASTVNSQSFASTLVNGGASNVIATIGTSGTVNVGLGTLTRNAGGTLDINLPATGSVTQASPGTGGTLLRDANGTAYATVGGNDWAANSTVTPGNIVSAATAGAAGASVYTTANSAATFSGNADITASFTATSGATVNSIRFNSGTSLALTLAGTNTVTTGGILIGSGITTGATITGGTLRAGTGKELVFITNKPGANVNITSQLVDSASGASSVTFRGNPNGATTGGLFVINTNNTYTGPTYITNGRVQAATATGTITPFGTGANAIVYIDGTQDGQFLMATSATVANPFVVIGNGLNEAATRRGVIRLDSSASANPTLTGSVTLLGDASIGNNTAINTGYGILSGNILTSNAQGATSFALTKILTGDIRLAGTANQQTATNIAAGMLNITNDGALGVASAPLTFTGTSTLQFQNALTLPATRSIAINSGVTATIDTNPTGASIGSSTIAGVISGPGAIFKNFTTANATLANNVTLSGANTFTGNVTIQGGWLTITNSSSLGLGAKTVTINNNTSWQPQLHLDPGVGNPAIDLPATIGFTVSASSASAATEGTIVNDSGNNIIRGAIGITSGGGGLIVATNNAGTLTLAGNIAPTATSRSIVLRGNGTGIISGTISNGSTVDMPITRDQGAGTWTLSGPNTYTGLTTVSNGTVKLGHSTALGAVVTSALTADNGTTVASGASLDLGGQSNINEVIRIAGNGVGGVGALTNSGPAATIGGASGASLANFRTSSTTVTVSGTPSITFSGGGAGSGATATPTIGVTAANFTISGGTTVYSVAPTVTIGGGTGATATATLTGGVVSGITITAAGSGFTGAPTISFSGGTITTAGTNPTGSGNNSNFNLGLTYTIGSGYTSPLTATFNNVTGATLTASLAGVVLTGNSSIGGAGDITINGPVTQSAGPFTLTKVGTNKLTLGADNTYTGATSITSGTLSVTGSIAATSAVSVGSAAPSLTPTLAGGIGGSNGGALVNDPGFAPFYGPSTTVGNVKGSTTILGPGAGGSAGHLAPGVAGVGTLTVGSLALNSGAVVDVEFREGSANDQVNITATGDGTTTGLVIASGVGINLYAEGTTSPYAPASSGTYHLMEYTGTLGGDPSTFQILNPVPGFTYTFDTSTTPQGSFVDLNVTVPEPGGLALGVLGAAGLLARRRRRSAEL